ncbi:hypothetical protein DFQ28_009543 [Apophysomyces sp. BC1034]|nr:hypothetical protein DFQ30_009162 [Apophysomyces sp. BC1015]KAG0172664.1 hypothetical protein DFQ29_008282 [Apophysomyces sp. BC1021]KAG0185329.1 hypothetical protein DFQ28_009543 [Apophysomyces sp. BC1034]
MALASIMATPIFPPSPPSSMNYKDQRHHRHNHNHHHHHHQQHQQQQQQQQQQQHRHPAYFYPSVLRSPPTSPEDLVGSPPSSPHSYTSTGSSSTTSSSVMHPAFVSSSGAPLTLQERRQRNKTASAKYRQKKNQQQNEMRQMIGRLSEKNAVLERQLQEIRMENEQLKATTDRLRGRMVAKKMLKQWIGRQKEQQQQPQPSAFRPSNNKPATYPTTGPSVSSIHAFSSSVPEDVELGIDIEQDDLDSLASD